MNRLRLPGAAIGSTMLFLLTSNALGWHSAERDRIRTFPTHDYGLIDYSRTVPIGKRNFDVAFLQDGIGSTDADDENVPGNTRLLSCKPEFGADGTPTFGDLTNCGISGRLGDAKYAWAAIRKQGSASHHSEHYLIAREAATRAGLIHSELFKTFWVRYATKNEYLASPYDHRDGMSLPNSEYIVGQSLLPTGGTPESTHAVRSVSLLELTQLPDLSNSVADWAAGNELCPLGGVGGAYDGDMIQACHEFERAMGAVNVTHFKPLNRAMWRHYHQLALTRMAQCAPLKDALHYDFYLDYSYRFSDYKPYSNHYTEAHECVREAMIYEMFGQHFLQDAWATGHMWNRWGHTSLIDFPNHVAGEEVDSIPVENLGPRQATIAGMVALSAGMVHGARDQIKHALETWDVPWLSESRLPDDPLNAPQYIEKPHSPSQKYVEWDIGGDRFPGGGDLYWWPERSALPFVHNDAAFVEQRDRLLNCSAKSMLDVYRQIDSELFEVPEPTGFSGAIDGIANVDSDYCFGQLATNEAMRAGLGVGNRAYLSGSIGSLGLLANRITHRYLAGGIAFPRADLDDIPENTREHALAADRNEFLDKAIDRMAMDLGEVRAMYARNAEERPHGTESALGISRDFEDIAVLGVPGMTEPPAGQLPVSYVDRLVSPTSSTTSPMDTAVSRMFWRGNVERTCQESVANDASLLHRLRQACIQGAEGSGNADACTECTYRAEMIIPWCESYTQNTTSPSRCQAAGALGAGAPSGAPAWWFDARSRFDGKVPGEPQNGSAHLCATSFFVALSWCTGTSAPLSESVETPSIPTGEEITSTHDCSDSFGTYQVRYGTWYRRGARVLVEPRPTEIINAELEVPGEPFVPVYEYIKGPWLPNMVTARRSSHTSVPGPDPCVQSDESVTYGDEQLLGDAVSPADASELTSYYWNGPQIPRCGNVQRVSWWFGTGADCSTVAGDLDFFPRQMNAFFADTGEGMFEVPLAQGVGCYVREPRKFLPQCTALATTCNAGWQCVPNQAPPTVRKIARLLAPAR